MCKLEEMLICFDPDLYYASYFFCNESAQFCRSDVANASDSSIAQTKIQQFGRVLELQMKIDTILFDILDTEMKLLQTYVFDENDLKLHNSFETQFQELHAEMSTIQANRIAIFACASMHPQYERYYWVRKQVNAIKKIVAYVNIDSYRIY